MPRQLDEQVSLGAKLNKENLVCGMAREVPATTQEPEGQAGSTSRPYLGQNREFHFGT